MTDRKSPSQSKRAAAPDALIRTSRKNKIELEEKDLDKVTGGGSDFQIMKQVDKSSPTL